MYKLRLKQQEPRKVIPASIMAIGQIGRIKDNSAYCGYIVLRAFNTLVCLDKPSIIWTDSKVLSTTNVELLYPGESVTLTVE